MTQFIGSRSLNFGSEGSGPVGVATPINNEPEQLVGDLTPVYRLYYLPNGATSSSRLISGSVTGLSARYLFGFDGFGPAAAAAVPLPDQTFTFIVPTPGAAPAMLLAGLAAARRRRA